MSRRARAPHTSKPASKSVTASDVVFPPIRMLLGANGLDRLGNLLERMVGEIGQEVHAAHRRPCSPLVGHTARRAAEGEDKDPPIPPNFKHGGRRSLLGVPACAGVLGARILEYLPGFDESRSFAVHAAGLRPAHDERDAHRGQIAGGAQPRDDLARGLDSHMADLTSTTVLLHAGPRIPVAQPVGPRVG
jgi:hypothetical protein